MMDRKRAFYLLLTTLSEALGLIFWLPLALTGNTVAAIVVLVAGLYGERLSFAIYARDRGLSKALPPDKPLPLINLMGITITEVIIWALWLTVHLEFGLIAGTIFLFIFMLIEHAAEMAILRSRPIMDYIVNVRTAFFTAVETVGAVAWLLLLLENQLVLGTLILLATLFVEHFIQGAELQPEGDAPGAADSAQATAG